MPNPETTKAPQPSPEYLAGFRQFEDFDPAQRTLFLELARVQAQNSVVLHLLRTAAQVSDDELTALMDVALGASFTNITSTLGKSLTSQGTSAGDSSGEKGT